MFAYIEIPFSNILFEMGFFLLTALLLSSKMLWDDFIGLYWQDIHNASTSVC